MVLATSGFDPYEAEVLTVSQVSEDGLSVAFAEALKHDHFGEIETVEGKTLDMRAEIGLLSRSIVIQAPESANAENFGYHGMFMPGARIFIQGVESVRGGQLGRPGRYPFHWLEVTSTQMEMDVLVRMVY